MRDPYEVLGVPRNATADQVKAAYRELAKKYHPDRYIDSPLAENANKKMMEINEAYDAIISEARTNQGYDSAGYSDAYQRIRELIQVGKLDEAEAVLENISESQRNARWYYFKGQVNYRRGWTDQAYTYFAMAYKMEPTNLEYRNAYEAASAKRSGGFRTNSPYGNTKRECSGCEICQGLLCVDCCCECCGGDCIPGC